MSQYYPETDFAGNPRVINGRIDFGALEAPDWDAIDEETAPSCVYPNPGKDELHIMTNYENAFVVVYDLNGRMMFERQIQGYSTTVVTEDWPSGMYFWKVVSTGSATLVRTGKWVKE